MPTPTQYESTIDVNKMLDELHKAVEPLRAGVEQERDRRKERDDRNKSLLKLYINVEMKNLIQKGLTYPVTPAFEKLLDTFIIKARACAVDIANVEHIEEQHGEHTVSENLLQMYISSCLEQIFQEDVPYKIIKSRYNKLHEEAFAFLRDIFGEEKARKHPLLSEIGKQADEFALPQEKVRGIVEEINNALSLQDLKQVLEKNHLLQREYQQDGVTYTVDRVRKRPAAVSELTVCIFRNTLRLTASALSNIVETETKKNAAFDPQGVLPELVGDRTAVILSKNARLVIGLRHGALENVSLKDLRELQDFSTEFPEIMEKVLTDAELSNAALHIYFNELNKCTNLSHLYSLTMTYLATDVQAPSEMLSRVAGSKIFTGEDFQRAVEASRKKEAELLAEDESEFVHIPNEYCQKLYEQTMEVLEHGDFIGNGIPLVRKLMHYLEPLSEKLHPDDKWYDWVTDEIGDVIMERVAALDAKTTTRNHLEETGKTREEVLERVREHLVHFGVVLDHIFTEFQLNELGFSEEQMRAFLIEPPPQVDNVATEPPKTEQSDVEYNEPQATAIPSN